MPNVNSFVSVKLTQSPIPATETILLFPGRSQDTTRANSMLSLDADLAQGGRWDGVPFRIVISGNAQVSASENITVAAYLNNAATPNTNLTTLTSDIKVCNTGTMASGATGSLAFYASAICIWNSTSATAGRIAFFPDVVSFKSISGTSAVSAVTPTIGNSGTALTSTQSLVQFYVTGLTGTADTTSTLNVYAQLDQI